MWVDQAFPLELVLASTRSAINWSGMLGCALFIESKVTSLISVLEGQFTYSFTDGSVKIN